MAVWGSIRRAKVWKKCSRKITTSASGCGMEVSLYFCLRDILSDEFSVREKGVKCSS
jgi:hypothetical protein